MKHEILRKWIPAFAGMTVLLGVFFLLPRELLAAPASGKIIGQSERFFIDPNFDRFGRKEVEAVLVRAGREGYFYIDSAFHRALKEKDRHLLGDKITELSDLFDTTIAPELRSWYGDEPAVGIDGEARTTILLVPSRGLEGGYVERRDGKPRTVEPRSNERKFMMMDVLSLPSGRGPRILAHEFAHLISLYRKWDLLQVEEERWLEEMRAIMAPTMLGLDPEGEKLVRTHFLRNSYDGLVAWGWALSDEASVTMWGRYLYSRFDKDLFVKTLKSKKTGISALAEAIDTIVPKINLAGVFADWVEYNFKTEGQGTRQTVVVTANAPGEINDTIEDWSSVGYRFAVEGGVWGTARNILRVHWRVASGERIKWRGLVETTSGLKPIEPEGSAEAEGTFYVTGAPGEIKSLLVMPISTYTETGSAGSARKITLRLTATLVGEMQPYVLSVSPSVVSGKAGEKIKIQGLDFTPDVQVTLNGVSVFEMQVTNRDSLKFKTPQLGAGPLTLTIKNALGRGFTGTGLLRVGTTRPDGTIIKGSNPAVYRLENGERRPFLNGRVFLARGYLWPQVIRVSDQELQGYPEGQILSYPDGALVRFGTKTALVSRGEKRSFIYPETIDQVFGYDPATAFELTETEWLSLPQGTNIIERNKHPDGALIKTGLSNERYLVEGGFKRFVSDGVFKSWGFQEKFVATVTQQEFDGYGWGKAWSYRDGSLLKTDDGNFWLISNGERRRFVSKEALTKAGYKIQYMLVSTNEELRDYEVGEEIR